MAGAEIETALLATVARTGPQKPSSLTAALRARHPDLAKHDIRPVLDGLVASGALFCFGAVYGLADQRAGFIRQQSETLRFAEPKCAQLPDGAARLHRARSALAEFAKGGSQD